MIFESEKIKHKKNVIFSLLILFYFILNQIQVQAQASVATINNSQLSYSPLTTAVPFVILSADPQNGSFGNAGISNAANTNSTFWNIAKMSHIEDKYVAAINYTPLLVNLNIDNYALLTLTNTIKFSNASTLSLFGKYLHIKSFDITSQTGEVLFKTTPIQGFIGLGYSMRLSRYLSAGISAKYIYSNLAPNYKPLDGSNSTLQAAATVAGDIGLDYEREIKENIFLTVGVCISNLGNKVNYTNDGRFGFIPANMGLGVGVKKILNNFHSISFGLDFNKLLVPVRPDDSANIKSYYNQSVYQSWYKSFSDAKGGLGEELKEIVINAGAQYWYRQILQARLGYVYQNPIKGYSSMVTMGFSLKYNKFIFDIAYGVPTYSNDATYNTSPLANSLRLGLSYKISDE